MQDFPSAGIQVINILSIRFLQNYFFSISIFFVHPILPGAVIFVQQQVESVVR